MATETSTASKSATFPTFFGKATNMQKSPEGSPKRKANRKSKEEGSPSQKSPETKKRGIIEIEMIQSQKFILKKIKQNEKIGKYLLDKVLKKIIFVPNRLINIIL